MQSLEELLEHYRSRHERLSDQKLYSDHGYETLNHNCWGGEQPRKRTIPYYDDASLSKVRNTGRWLHNKPTVHNCTNIMISFVIKNGYKYAFSPRIPSQGNQRAAARERRESRLLTSELSLAVEDRDWRLTQRESYKRKIRDGEYFRRFSGSGSSFDVWFIEPEFIINPKPNDILTNPQSIPAVVAERLERQEVLGDYGVVRDPQDERKVIGYWHFLGKSDRAGRNMFEWINPSELQHVKDGVDEDDPRGVPRFYWSLCNNLAIEEVDGAMVDLTLIQAEHAAIYNFDTAKSTQQNLLDIAQNRVQKQDTVTNGRPAAPGVVHARAFDVDLPGMDVSGKDFIEIIQQEQRFIGGFSGIPEHMSTSDANTGNRSSLVAAEGPFDRRVQMEQEDQFDADRPLLLRMLPTEARTRINVRNYTLTAETPVAASRDAQKEAQTEIALVESELKSLAQAREKLRIDNERANAEINNQRGSSVSPSEES